MFKAIFNDRLGEIVHVLDDSDDKWQQYPASDFHYAYRKSPSGTFTSLYGDKLEKITSFDETDTDLFESDLNIEMKVLLDLYKGNEEVPKGHRIVIYDIETSTEGGFPNIMTGDKAITAIALYDYATDKYYSLILDKESKIKDKIDGNHTLRAFKTEERLLSNFLTLWRELNPTIISGWNSWMFDDPYIYNRIKAVLGKKAAYKLSPLGIVYQNQFTKRLVIGGVSSLDYIELYKKWCPVMKSSYSLANVSNDEELEHRKLTYKGNLDDLYKNDINRFIEYNLVDVKVVKDLNDKYDFINLAIAVCTKGKIPYERFNFSSWFIDGAILDYLHVNNLIGPNRPANYRQLYTEQEKSDDDGFIGAYVKEAEPNIFKWIVSCDITSLYPSTIMSLNISNETLIGKIENWDWDSYKNGSVKEIKINDFVYTRDEFEKMKSNNSIAIGVNGGVYTLKKRGVIPTILDRWFSERVHFRKLAGQYAKEGDKEKEEFYDRRQKREKVFLNSIYGSTGMIGGRWYNVVNAEAVTTSGQAIIKSGERLVNNIINSALNTPETDDRVVAIDTDSLYFSLNALMENDKIDENDKVKYSIDKLTYIADKINVMYSHMLPIVFNVPVDQNRIKIIPDVVAKRAIWLGKKRYSLLKVWDMEKMKEVKDKVGNEGKIEHKGIDVIRSSFPYAFQKMLGSVLENVLRDKTFELIDVDVMEFEESIKDITPINLSAGTSVKWVSRKGDKQYNPKERVPFSIVKGSPISVKAALAHNDILKASKLDTQFRPFMAGEKVKWMYLVDCNPYAVEALAFRGDDSDSDVILRLLNEYGDKEKMYMRVLKNKLLKIYVAMKRNFPNRGGLQAAKSFNFNEEW